MQFPEALRRQKRDFEIKAPEKAAALAAATERLKRCGIAENCLAAGQKAPDFTLIDHEEKEVNLYRQLERDPVVIKFFRGDWCAYCNLELQALQQKYDAIKKAGFVLLAVSPMLPSLASSFADRLGLDFPILSDRGNRVAAKFGVVFTVDDAVQPVYEEIGIDLPAANGDDSFRLPLPATYVINQKRIITFRHADADYTARLDPDTLLEHLQTNSTD